MQGAMKLFTYVLNRCPYNHIEGWTAVIVFPVCAITTNILYQATDSLHSIIAFLVSPLLWYIATKWVQYKRNNKDGGRYYEPDTD